MIPELHGKHYYIESDVYQEIVEIQRLISENPVLKDELFVLTKQENGKWVIRSEARCETFRGDKYHEWERIKETIYRNRRGR